ncbi:unnamed protein product [Arctia plantaginis]|uniref:Uncharacterized protein n=1 Tax=Arctia plantaginis TaxID=874455 RepID=A0A8S1AAI8_ARCPL|nr:unnamed protein product [Arctia plantaginis]
MDEFEKFELTQEDILHLENIEINLLNHSFEVDTDADVQPSRRIILSESENSDDEISRVIADTVGETFQENTQEMNGVRTRVCSWTTEQLQSAFDDIDKKDKGINEIF